MAFNINYIPINRAWYIDHFSVYIIVLLFEKKRETNINLVKIQKKKNSLRSILVYQRFNYWVLFVTTVVTID